MSAFGIPIALDQIAIVSASAPKRDVLGMLVDIVAKNPAVPDRESLWTAVLERESVSSTGIGNGIAIPHVRLSGVEKATLAVGVAPQGIDFAALDNKPVHVIVFFAMPEGADKEYLGLLARVMLALRNKEMFGRLVGCKTAEDVHALLND